MRNGSAWTRRSALMYTVGSWTILGFLGVQTYRLVSKEDKKEQSGEAAARDPGSSGCLVGWVKPCPRSEGVSLGSERLPSSRLPYPVFCSYESNTSEYFLLRITESVFNQSMCQVLNFLMLSTCFLQPWALQR